MDRIRYSNFLIRRLDMAHFAKVENGIVTSVIVVDQETLNLGHWGDPALWIQTSYNTQGGVHTQGGTPLRKNYAGVGMLYDAGRDAFYAPKPYPSWTLNETTCHWNPPVPMPESTTVSYVWRESDTSWVVRPNYPTDGKDYTWDLEAGAWVEQVVQ